MAKQKVFLKPNVQIEPLFNQWWAYPYLISPASSAMYVAFAHLPLLRSYIEEPEVHVRALTHPAYRGGPFIDFNGERIDEVRDFLAKTETELGHLIQFAHAVRDLESMIEAEAKGFSLETLYPRIPDLLRGYVELFYDLNNRPGIKFLEKLLYKSRYYKPSMQSVLLSLVHQDARPFVFSTPRLGDEAHLQINHPFSERAWDEMFRMKEIPRPYSEIRNEFDISENQNQKFQTFFTETAPRPRVGYEGEGVRVRYYGHACVVVETRDTAIMIDPLIGYEYKGGAPRFTYADLPEVIDYVLITHTHHDHAVLETLLQLRHKIRHLIVPKNIPGALQDPSIKTVFENLGFKNVLEVDVLDEITTPDGVITAIPFTGEHADVNINTKSGYLVRLKGRSILFMADANALEPRMYNLVREITGDLDVLFTGLECKGAPLTWLYGALLSKPISRAMDQSRENCGPNFEKANRMAKCFNVKQVYVYAMAQEPWLSHLLARTYDANDEAVIQANQLIEESRKRGLKAERLECMKELIF